jgi:hypothetical protein
MGLSLVAVFSFFLSQCETVKKVLLYVIRYYKNTRELTRSGNTRSEFARDRRVTKRKTETKGKPKLFPEQIV